MAQIVLEDVSFTYPGSDTPVIDRLNLSVGDGEAHALLGASGAGKTTLLSLLSGILTPTSGVIRFAGEEVTQLDGRRRKVAQVFQFPVLYDGLSVADNLWFPLRMEGRSRNDSSQRIHEVAAELGLEQYLSQSVPSLSLYQKQLLAVGKALVRTDTSLVLLDEPLTAVAPRDKWMLRQVLKKAQHDFGTTMIYVTHDQTEALTFADQVSILTAQGIEQTGTPQEIYERPRTPFVGHFVGSPGMNFLPGAVAGQTDVDVVGFRPEWATVVEPTTEGARLEALITGIDPGSTVADEPYGIVRCTLTESRHDLAIATPLRWPVGAHIGVKLDRTEGYADGVRVDQAGEAWG